MERSSFSHSLSVAPKATTPMHDGMRPENEPSSSLSYSACAKASVEVLAQEILYAHHNTSMLYLSSLSETTQVSTELHIIRANINSERQPCSKRLALSLRALQKRSGLFSLQRDIKWISSCAEIGIIKARNRDCEHDSAYHRKSLRG